MVVIIVREKKIHNKPSFYYSYCKIHAQYQTQQCFVVKNCDFENYTDIDLYVVYL